MNRKKGTMKSLQFTIYSLQKKIILLATYCLLLTTLIGCAMLKEGAKGVAALSTKALEEERADAVKQTFNYGYSKCYEDIKAMLKRYGSYIYAEDAKKKMIAIYISEEDTTPVGIFLKAVDENNTQIEVSSSSTYAKEFIARRITRALIPEKGKKWEGESDAAEDLPGK